MIVFPWRTSEQRLGIRITTTYHVSTSIFQYHNPAGFAKQDINSGSLGRNTSSVTKELLFVTRAWQEKRVDRLSDSRFDRLILLVYDVHR